jgi:dihydrofolate synthase/folylpolyglutamate synthase
MKSRTLEEWIAYIATIHALEMDLGLERVRSVAEKLNILHANIPVITIAGTNGKGSCVAGLEAIYRAAGYTVGAFTSPYLIRLNEEVRVNGVDASDEDLCRAFAEIEARRGDVTLTIFEFNTLAALIIFQKAELDVILLEVGLGGRLDAVNVVDADLAIISSIALDHVDRLGDTRELIALEKAGVLRAGVPAVSGDFDTPVTLVEYAAKLPTRLYTQGKDFYFEVYDDSWDWQAANQQYKKLPLPNLALQNMASVLMGVELLQDKLAVDRASIDKALARVKLPGRLQVFPGAVTRIFDVAHNPAASRFLAQKLLSMPCEGKTHAVFSMLADKDIVGSLREMKSLVHDWYIAALNVQRGTPVTILQESFLKAEVDVVVKPFPDISEAYQAAIDAARPGDRVVVFGSFYTVAEVINHVL